jgi:hypothetical protein
MTLKTSKKSYFDRSILSGFYSTHLPDSANQEKSKSRKVFSLFQINPFDYIGAREFFQVHALNEFKQRVEFLFNKDFHYFCDKIFNPGFYDVSIELGK